MQRVSALLPSWDRSKHYNTAPARTNATGALNKVFGGWGSLNRINPAAFPTRFGREAYWPASLDKECDKAARILKSFCTDGFLALDEPSPPPSPTSPTSSRNPSEVPPTPPPPPRLSTSFVTKKIPPRIIQNAVGLAVFSCMRSGLWISGSGGAGLITARKADGTWSPPSGIILHTSALGFVMGVDIYDCVLVINSVQTLELFTRSRLSLGIDVNLAVGPLVEVESADRDMRRKHLDETVLTYVKARGRHQPIQLDGSIVAERSNENVRFYDVQNVTVLDILAGNIPKTVPETLPLFEVIKAAEGRTDYDRVLMKFLAQQPAPGDAIIETPKDSLVTTPQKIPFGVPNVDDPDPFGVIGLEMAGIEIREAGTRLRPSSTQFEFNPSTTSPLFGQFNRQSLDTFLARSNRGSYMSYRTQATAMTDAGTQTDVGSTLDTTISAATSIDGGEGVSETLPPVYEPEEIDYTKIDTSFIARFSSPSPEEPRSPARDSLQPIPTIYEERRFVDQGMNTTDSAVEVDAARPEPVPLLAAAANKAAAHQATVALITGRADEAERADGPAQADEPAEDADDEEDEEDDGGDEEEPIIYEVATTAASSKAAIMSSQVTQVIQAKGALVTIPKRVPPPLPPRSPARTSRASKSDFGDVSSLRSPLRSSFNSNDVAMEVQGFQDATNTENNFEGHVRRLVGPARLSLAPDEGNRARHSVSSLRSITTIEEAAGDGQRWSTASNSPQLSLATPTVDGASSVESDGEPNTPRGDSGLAERAAEKVEKLKRASEISDVQIVPHQSSQLGVA